MSLDIEDLKERFLNVDFDEQTFSITAANLAEYAKACGELAPRYTDPNHPDFQAPPTFPSSFNARRDLPDGFPKLPGLGMDAGKAVTPRLPIRPDTKLIGKTHIHDIYTKSGRSGRMVFIVLRMELYDEEGAHMSSADTSMVIRERPDA
jgi:hypothetical protein